MQLSDGEIRDGDKTNGDDGSEEEKQYQILDPTGQSYYQPSDFVRVITFKFYVYILEKLKRFYLEKANFFVRGKKKKSFVMSNVRRRLQLIHQYITFNQMDFHKYTKEF